MSDHTEDETGWGEEGMSWFVWCLLLYETIAIIEDSVETMTAEIYWRLLDRS